MDKGGIIHHEGKAISIKGTRADGSLVEGYLCEAQQHGVVFDSHALHGAWQWRGRRVALLFYTHALPEHMPEADVAKPCIPVGLSNVSHCFDLRMWYCM